MTFTYAGDPAASDLAAVRFKIQDTDTTDQLLSDAEITFAIDASDGIDAAAASCAKVIAFQFARKANMALGSLRIDYGSRADFYAQLARELSRGIAPKLSEISEPSDKLTRGLMDNNEITSDLVED
jgi:hypothetical protein